MEENLIYSWQAGRVVVLDLNEPIEDVPIIGWEALEDR